MIYRVTTHAFPLVIHNNTLIHNTNKQTKFEEYRYRRYWYRYWRQQISCVGPDTLFWIVSLLTNHIRCRGLLRCHSCRWWTIDMLLPSQCMQRAQYRSLHFNWFSSTNLVFKFLHFFLNQMSYLISVNLSVIILCTSAKALSMCLLRASLIFPIYHASS